MHFSVPYWIIVFVIVVGSINTAMNLVLFILKIKMKKLEKKRDERVNDIHSK